MDPQTQRALGNLNRDFYERHASAFDAKRERAWPGWRRVLAASAAKLGRSQELSVLDVGCGNGRLAKFLAETWSGDLEYVGVDASAALLDLARSRSLGSTSQRAEDAAASQIRTRFHRGDLIAQAPSDVFAATGRDDFDLCVAFGILHHIPGRQRRCALADAMADVTRVGGFLALSFWNFDMHERFRLRYRESSPRSDADSIEVSQLETGDHLLAWGDDGDVRYCHAASASEITEHIAELCGRGFRVADDFESEGQEKNFNRYVVFERVSGNRT